MAPILESYGRQRRDQNVGRALPREVERRRPRLGTQLGPCDDDSGESEAGDVVSSESVISGRDASPILEAADHAFHDVSTLIGGAIEGVWGAPRGGGGNGRSDLPVL